MADTLQAKSKSLREKLTAWDLKNDPKAPLTDTQKDSFMELTTLASNRPLPIQLPVDEKAQATTISPPSADDSEAKDFPTKQLQQDKIYNAQQFFSWFSEVEEKMESEESDPQRVLVDDLRQCRAESDHVVDEVSQALQHLEELKRKYIMVSTKTNALHEACENLLEDQTKLVNMAESINNKLAYFNELERISSKLGSPTLTVTNESFVPMLSRLDECIAYLDKNPQYKESPVFLAKFHQCLSRAMSLIRTHVVHILQNATQQVLPKKDIPAPTDDAFTLFYGKFRTNAPRIKMLMEQVEQRLDKSPQYVQLIADCHQCYLQQRLALLGPSVTGAIADLASKHSRDHCALVRSGCAFLVHVCEDEHQLFSHFFSKPTSQLDGMLESLCCSLYDVLRPLIIHINHLETLAELCSILKLEMLEDHVQNNAEALTAFEAVCTQMLEDVQERLVYRTHIYIRQEILNYHPAEGDLRYPEKLEMMESIAATMKRQEFTRSDSASSSLSTTSAEVEQINAAVNSHTNGAGEEAGISHPFISPEDRFVTVPLTDTGGGSNMPMSPADLHGMWYPTVRRTLVCLSKLYRCIDKTTFQGLSQETLSMCIHSLTSACDSISKNKKPMDGQLFLIKHLLILREQIAPFHVDFSVKETALDFSKIRGAAVDFLRSKSKLFALNSTNSVLQFILEGTPQVTETFLDSKKEVDNQLKKTCEDFIYFVSQHFIGPLQDFLSKANTVLQMIQEDATPNMSLRQQPFASPEKLHDAVAQTYRHLKQRKSAVQRSMALYLANKDTEYILFKPIKSNVQQAFQQLHLMLEQHYSTEDQQIVSPPTLEQINLLLASQPSKS